MTTHRTTTSDSGSRLTGPGTTSTALNSEDEPSNPILKRFAHKLLADIDDESEPWAHYESIVEVDNWAWSDPHPTSTGHGDASRVWKPSAAWREGARELAERLSLYECDTKTVCVALVMLADVGKGGETWEGLSYAVLQRRTGASRQSVWRAISWLRNHNIITQTYPGSRTAQSAARYRFNPPEKWRDG